MSRNIVFEGWLTKSPPSKRIWRTKWRRRWFALRQGELPGQYFLDYYADRNCRRLKGTINLDLCEQVDAGLHMERAGNGTLDPKLRGSVFTIQTQSRTYHLEADSETDMEKWVDAICRVCGLRSTEHDNVIDSYQPAVAVSATNEHYECADTTGPYIPISECITGVRAQDQKAFTFDTGSILNQPIMCDKSTATRGQQIMGHGHVPQIRNNQFDCSENESNISDEDCKSLNASHPNLPEYSVSKSFTRLVINTAQSKNGSPEDPCAGPPVPPRPPKTFSRRNAITETVLFHGPRMEPPEPIQPNYTGSGTPWLRVPRRMSHSAAPHSPGRLLSYASANRYTDDDDDENSGALQLTHSTYYNMTQLPPAVDRALKPRYSSHSIGHINYAQSYSAQEDIKPNLQYLDLDLHTSKPPTSKQPDRRNDIAHGKSMSAVEADSAYKTVDFLKTEAFNITRQDAEASRSHQC